MGLLPHRFSDLFLFFFFFNDTATTEIYTLSLHDALPILPAPARRRHRVSLATPRPAAGRRSPPPSRAPRVTPRRPSQTARPAGCRAHLQRARRACPRTVGQCRGISGRRRGRARPKARRRRPTASLAAPP